MALQNIFNLPAHLANRIQCGTRVLKNHRHFAATDVGQFTLLRLEQIEAAEHRCAAGDFGRTIRDAQHGVGQHRLAGATLAHQTDGFAFANRKVDVVQSMHGTGAGAKFEAEVAHIEQRDFGFSHVRLPEHFMCVSPGTSCASPRVDHVAQAITQEVEAEHRQHQHQTGKQRHPPFA